MLHGKNLFTYRNNKTTNYLNTANLEFTNLNKIWELKDKNKNYKLNWEILCRTKTKPINNKTCKLCSLEKYEIGKTDKQYH